MKLEKTKKDIDKMKADEERLSILQILRELQHYKFNVGDVLVKLVQEGYEDDAPWIPELDSIGAPQRYVYVFENDFGIGYIKKLHNTSSSALGVGQCLASFKPDRIRFKIDPEYVDHLIIGEGQFDHKEIYKNLKKFRKEANVENLKISMPAATTVERLALWEQLQLGTCFYEGYKEKNEIIEFTNYYKVIRCPKNKAKITLEIIDSVRSYVIGDKDSYTKKEFSEEGCMWSDNSVYSFIKPAPIKDGEEW